MMNTRLGFIMLAVSLALTSSDPLIAAQSQAAVDLEADRIEIQDLNHKAVFTGSVRARQGSLTISADKATADYIGSTILGDSSAKPEVQRIVASGNVIITKPGETASGNIAIYELKANRLLLLGNVTLNRSTNVVHGERLTLNLTSDTAVMNGTGGARAIDRNDGRVTGTFAVPQHQSNQPDK